MGYLPIAVLTLYALMRPSLQGWQAKHIPKGGGGIDGSAFGSLFQLLTAGEKMLVPSV